MLITLLLGLILALIIVIFIFQNPSPVIVHFLVWHFQGSLALLLLLTFIFGIIISLLVAIPLVIRRMHRKTNLIGTKEKPEDASKH
jgi:uncharacterized integral membrane protein